MEIKARWVDSDSAAWSRNVKAVYPKFGWTLRTAGKWSS